MADCVDFSFVISLFLWRSLGPIGLYRRKYRRCCDRTLSNQSSAGGGGKSCFCCVNVLYWSILNCSLFLIHTHNKHSYFSEDKNSLNPFRNRCSGIFGSVSMNKNPCGCEVANWYIARNCSLGIIFAKCS